MVSPLVAIHVGSFSKFVLAQVTFDEILKNVQEPTIQKVKKLRQRMSSAPLKLCASTVQ